MTIFWETLSSVKTDIGVLSVGEALSDNSAVQPTISVCPEKSTLPYLFDRAVDVAIKNEGAALIFCSGLVTAVIILTVAKSAALIIQASK